MRAEPHAERLHEADDVLLGKMLRAVECHVLDEMRKPPVVVVFEHRTGLHPQRSARRAPAESILSDVIRRPFGSVPTVISGSTGMVRSSGAF